MQTGPMGLTEKQAMCLKFIKERIAEQGVAPSFEEMKEHMGLRSKSGVHRIITALEARGHIRRLNHQARAIALVRDGSARFADWDSVAMTIMRLVQESDRQHLSRTKALKAIYHVAKEARLASRMNA